MNSIYHLIRVGQQGEEARYVHEGRFPTKEEAKKKIVEMTDEYYYPHDFEIVFERID